MNETLQGVLIFLASALVIGYRVYRLFRVGRYLTQRASAGLASRKAGTTPCPRCHQNIPVRDYQAHMALHAQQIPGGPYQSSPVPSFPPIPAPFGQSPAPTTAPTARQSYGQPAPYGQPTPYGQQPYSPPGQSLAPAQPFAPAQPAPQAQPLYTGSLDGVPRTFYHQQCQTSTQMPEDTVRTYLANPFAFQLSAYCMGCQTYVPLDQVFWTETRENVGQYMERLQAQARGS